MKKFFSILTVCSIFASIIFACPASAEESKSVSNSTLMAVELTEGSSVDLSIESAISLEVEAAKAEKEQFEAYIKTPLGIRNMEQSFSSKSSLNSGVFGTQAAQSSGNKLMRATNYLNRSVQKCVRMPECHQVGGAPISSNLTKNFSVQSSLNFTSEIKDLLKIETGITVLDSTVNGYSQTFLSVGGGRYNWIIFAPEYQYAWGYIEKYGLGGYSIETWESDRPCVTPLEKKAIGAFEHYTALLYPTGLQY